MEIRKGVLQDTAQILILYEELFVKTAEISPLIFQVAGQDEGFVRKQLLSPMGDFYVATKENIVIGFALVVESQAPPYNAFIQQSYGYIMDAVVAPEFRGQGIGSKLLKKCTSWAKERELAYVELNVLEGNENAKRLYKKLGFENSVISMTYTL